MKILTAFADLTYTEKGLSSNAFPYAVSLVASYAKKKFQKLTPNFLNILKILKNF